MKLRSSAGEFRFWQDHRKRGFLFTTHPLQIGATLHAAACKPRNAIPLEDACASLIPPFLTLGDAHIVKFGFPGALDGFCVA